MLLLMKKAKTCDYRTKQTDEYQTNKYIFTLSRSYFYSVTQEKADAFNSVFAEVFLQDQPQLHPPRLHTTNTFTAHYTIYYTYT